MTGIDTVREPGEAGLTVDHSSELLRPTAANPTASNGSTQVVASLPKMMTSSVLPGAPMVRSMPQPPKVLPVGNAVPIELPDADLKTELENVQLMFRDYRTRMGENPVGSNVEIMKAVMGGNPAHATLGPPAGQALNQAGELVDRWGTAYFFHQLSKNVMEIRSAGPDGRLWTADDLVFK